MLKRFTLCGVALLGLATVACGNPIAPSSYTCSTQPRLYMTQATGVWHTEVDTYESDTPCPIVPVS